VHGWIANTRRAHVYHFLQKLALRHFDHVIAVSDAIEAELLRCGVSSARISKVTNAVEMPVSAGTGNGALRRELGIGPGAKLVGTVGRLSKEKGLPYFLEAAAQIQAECPEAVFVVVGEGRERADLEAQAVRLGLNGRVHFYGYCREMEKVYPSLDLFVLPSLTEGLPMTLLEAISFEVPFVASAVGEIPVLLGAHAAGQLTPPGDVPALAQAMRSALRNPEAAKGVARGARRHLLDNWNVERWRGRIEGIYQQVVAGR
jgi:glycosyltransferase involved in cell wall biosynthesis